jgi:hypothetical protein
VDVQHKKRGRPRLRDDRETRFDSTRFQQPPESMMRRPVSLYAPASAAAVPFDDPLRRSQSYRVLKSQPPEPAPSRYLDRLDRGQMGTGNMYPAPLSMPPRPLEPVAFLTVDLELVKVSNTFVDAIGAGMAQSIQGRKLDDIIAPQEREKSAMLHRSLQEERSRRDPDLLPPLAGMDGVIHDLPFDAEYLSKLSLDRQDYFTFISAEGQPRSYPIRVGLAKQDRVYFVVLLLHLQPRPLAHLPPSPHSRELPYSYQPEPYPPQLTPVSASFDSSRSRFGDVRESRAGSLGPRPPSNSGQTMTSMSPGMSPGIGSNVPSYAPAGGRIEHPAGPSYQIPRSELPVNRPSLESGYQLPPIRSQSQPGSSVDPRAGRVDIEGLIDRPDHHTQRGPP